MFNLEYWSVSKKGTNHTKNEDSTLALNKLKDLNLALFMVCDGVGGYPGGDIASQKIVSTFSNKFYSMVDNSQNIEDFTRATVAEVNKEIMEFASVNLQYPRLSSTLVGLIIDDEDYHAFSIGDSRIYKRDKTGFRQINEDDSKVWGLFKSGLISKREIMTQEDKNKITAAVGFSKDLDLHQYSAKLEDYYQFILCSDGLTDFVSEGDIEKILSQEISVRERCELLLNKALDCGSDDDITIIVIEGTQDSQFETV